VGAVGSGLAGAAVPARGRSTVTVASRSRGNSSHVAKPAFATITAPAIHGQRRSRIGGRTTTGWRWTVVSVGTLAASWRFCSAFLKASRMYDMGRSQDPASDRRGMR
jgi:hypothetical protein